MYESSEGGKGGVDLESSEEHSLPLLLLKAPHECV
jgi:hypothetical protein